MTFFGRKLIFPLKFKVLKIKLLTFQKSIIYEGDKYYIKPIFKLNSGNKISVSAPSLPFSADEIKSIFGFDMYINKDNLDELIKEFNSIPNDLAYNFTLEVNQEKDLRLIEEWMSEWSERFY